METSGFWPIFLFGAFGGMLVEILRWWKLREAPELPLYAKSPFYWSITVIMIFSGGIVATMYGLEPRNAIMVVNLGASTPALISAFATSHGGKAKEPVLRSGADEKVDGQDKGQHSIRHFLTFGR